jgi:hypothetical protein
MIPTNSPTAADITIWLLNFPLWLLASRPLLPYFHEVLELGKHAKAFPLWCCCSCLDHIQNLLIHRLHTILSPHISDFLRLLLHLEGNRSTAALSVKQHAKAGTECSKDSRGMHTHTHKKLTQCYVLTYDKFNKHIYAIQ